MILSNFSIVQLIRKQVNPNGRNQLGLAYSPELSAVFLIFFTLEIARILLTDVSMFLEVIITLAIWIFALFTVAVMRNRLKVKHYNKIIRKISDGKRRIFCSIVVFALAGALLISMLRGEPLFSQGLSVYVTKCFVSLSVVAALFAISKLLAIWAYKSTAVNINTASEQKLKRVFDIDATLAKAIVKSRPFKQIEDIRGLPGFDEKMVRQMKYKITIR